MQATKRIASDGQWLASGGQLAAAVAAQKAKDAGKSDKDQLLAAKEAAESVAKREAEESVLRRYMLAIVNRTNMAGRFGQLSSVELLDIVASTSIEGGQLAFEDYRKQLELIEKGQAI